MSQPRILYASPFPPQASGIADYSMAMVEALRGRFDLTLYVRGEEGPPGFPALRRGVDPVAFEAFDERVYHIGNNFAYHDYIYEAALRHPGVVVLHECVLYYLVIGLYRERPDFYRRLYEIGGARAVSIVKYLVKEGADLMRYHAPERLPLNRELLRSENRFIVHSHYAERMVRAEAGDQARVCRINMLLHNRRCAPVVDRAAVWERLGIPAGATVLASFGFVAATKLNDVVCRVVERLQRKDVYYVMVGHGDSAEGYVSDRIRITGYVGMQAFEEYLAASDMVLNLRYPTMGETSSSLLRALEAGKPCIVSDVGWFSELPDNAVLKLDAGSRTILEEQLYEALDIFLRQPEPFLKMGREAAAYAAREHAPERIAGEMEAFLRGL